MKQDKSGPIVCLTETEHAVSHSKLWTYSKVIDAVSGPVYYLLIKTGSKKVKGIMQIDVGETFKATFFVRPEVATLGTESLMQENGENSYPVETRVYYGTTITEEGEQRVQLFSGSDSPSVKAGAGVDGRAPFVIAKNTEVLVKLEFVGPATVSFLGELFEY